MIGKLGELFRKFPKVFWVSMSFELLERGAYYSFTPIIFYHALYNLHVPEWIALQILTFLWPFQYGLPILTGALVEKVGYRKQILFAFILMTVAYFSLSRAVNTYTLLFAVVTLGISIGSYKPLISAIVAKVTTSEDRNVAFGIYYVIVNMAAGFFPIGFVVAQLAGYLTPSIYHIIFMVGAILVAINILIALFLFEDIPKSEKVKTVKDSINNLKISMKDNKFITLVLLVAGFWALYSMQLTGIIAIIYGYRWVPIWFTPIVYAIFNPLTIVVAGPVLSKLIEKVESIRVMVTGMLIFVVGLTVLVYGVADWRTLVFGIIILSVGEFMVIPGFYSFTSKLATEDKVSAYIGSTFLAPLLGLVIGSFVLGVLASYIVVEIQMPYFFLGIALSFSLFLFIGYVIYYQLWGQDVIERAKRIAEEEEGEKREVEEGYAEPLVFRLYETKVPIVLSLLLIPIILFSTFSLGTFNYIGPIEDEVEEEEIPPFSPFDYSVINIDIDEYDDELLEGQSAVYPFTIKIGEDELLEEGQLVKSIKLELSWQDEPDAGFVRSWPNEPDVFEITLSNSTFSHSLFAGNEHGQARTLPLYLNLTHELIDSTNGTGDWEVTVELISAGNYLVGPTGRLDSEDNSNTYHLRIAVEAYAKVEG